MSNEILVTFTVRSECESFEREIDVEGLSIIPRIGETIDTQLFAENGSDQVDFTNDDGNWFALYATVTSVSWSLHGKYCVFIQCVLDQLPQVKRAG